MVADGLHVITNAHVLPKKIDSEKKEIVAVFAGKANLVEIREATKVAEDRDHDLAILKIIGRPLPAMSLGDSNRVRKGEIYAFTGFQSVCYWDSMPLHIAASSPRSLRSSFRS